MSKRNQNSFRPTLTVLENRDVPSVQAITLSGGVLNVKANNATTDVLVSQGAGVIIIEDVIAGSEWGYRPASVNSIVVTAGNGTTIFTAATSTPATAKVVKFVGGAGTDTFVGDAGPVSMVAGSGADTLTSVAGNDTMIGGAGTDYIKGGSGNNLLEGGTGSDYLNGGTGVETVVAGVGNDTIVTINGQNADTIYPASLGSGVIWLDDINGVTDNVVGDDSNYVVQEVSGFANGASSVLNGGAIAEPTPLPGNFYEAFNSRPLFATGGPTLQDVKQYVSKTATGVNGTGTNLDDSWLLAALGSIAATDPQAIEDNVVNFGDGTYGVDLAGNYYRVDNKLPVNEYGDTVSAYASTGVQNSMWVPIVEKAFAYYATLVGQPSYANLQAANGGASVYVYSAFNASVAGSIPLNGPGGFPNSTALGSEIASLFQGGYSSSIGLTTAVTGTSQNTGKAVTLPANREYTLMSYTENLSGVVTSVVLRDPDGVNPLGVTVTIANLFLATGSLDFGLV